MKARKAKIKVLENEKIARLARLAVARKGQEALNAYTRGNIDILSRGMKKEWVDALLDWYKVPNSEGCHYIADRRKKWKDICANSPPLDVPWTDADAKKLENLQEFQIDMSGTALGRLKELKKRELSHAADSMSVQERSELIGKLVQQNEDEALAKRTKDKLAVWLYRRSCIAVKNMEAECSPLDICLVVLRVIIKLRGRKGPANSGEGDDQMEFFQAFSSIGKRRDTDFIIDLGERTNEMAADENLNKEVLRIIDAGSKN